MSDDESQKVEMVTFHSARFGELEVPEDSVIEFPSGMIGFPRAQRFVMLDYKPPFSWLHSVEDPALAFVVVDGFEFGSNYDIPPPIGDKDTGLEEGDEYAILVVVTVRQDAKLTTANLKAPLFVNVRNRKGVQVIFDSPSLSTRHPLWDEESLKEEQGDPIEDGGEEES
jgi:flagellar assembly factor FliW